MFKYNYARIMTFKINPHHTCVGEKFWGEWNRPKSKLVSGKTGFLRLKTIFRKFFAKMFKNIQKGLLFELKHE